MDTSEGYDESGFKIVSRAVLEKELIDVLEDEENKPKNLKSVEANFINNIIENLNENMGIIVSDSQAFVVSNCINKLNLTASRAKYKKFTARKRGRKPTYESFYDDYAITFTLAYYLIALQTSVPSVKTSKTFPGCVRSFSGYPVQNDTDFSALKYLVCVALKNRSSARPWKQLPKYTRNTFNVLLKSLRQA